MLQTLVFLGVHPTQARMFSDPMSAAMALHDILTPERRAAFIAHCILESARLTSMEENLFYRSAGRIRAVWPRRFKTDADAEPFVGNPKALANKVYSLRNGNGSLASGDGWRYRGRGLFQLTGKANYRAAQDGIGRPYVDQPDLVSQPSDACLTAAFFWSSNGCNEAIDSGEFDRTTRIINGPAMLHAAERRHLFSSALNLLEGSDVRQAA